MKLKRFLVFALVLALCVFAFAACGGSNETETNAPGTETEAPGTETETPGTETEAPDTETEAPDTETEAPDTETEAPDTETEAPETETEAPHTHELKVEEKAATCSETGYRLEVCKACGTVVSEVAYEKLACTPAAAATCTDASACAVCGKVLEDAKGHTWGEAKVVAATCQKEGTSTKTCTVCGEVTVETLPTTDEHAFRVHERVAPESCSDVGYARKVCDYCKTEVVEELTLAHTFGATSATESPFTVGKNGKLYAVCSGCFSRIEVASVETLVKLDFDKASLEEEVKALANDKNGLSYDLFWVNGQEGQKEPAIGVADGRTVLQTKTNKIPQVSFNGKLFEGVEYYRISFDWRVTKYSGSNNQGVFGLVTGGSYKSALEVTRSDGTLVPASGSALASIVVAEKQ